VLKLFFPILIFFAQLVSPAYYHESEKKAAGLNIDKANEVRISLFSQHPPDSLRLTVEDGSVKIFSANNVLHFRKINMEFSAVQSSNQLYFITSGVRLPVDSLLISADNVPTRVITDRYGYRHYGGTLTINPRMHDNAPAVINTLDLEEYVASVVGSEMDFENIEALKTQAVVSRTYALWSLAQSSHKNYDLNDFEDNQMYVGTIRQKPHYAKAAFATHGEILTWSNQLILAAYSSTCGGRTANNEDVWNGEPHPYLRSQDDRGMCSLSPHYRWKQTINRNLLQESIQQTYNFKFTNHQLVKDYSNRIKKVNLFNKSGEFLLLSGNEFRLLINRTIGPMAVKSTHFSWFDDDRQVVLEGGGLGHGVGLCQWGTRGFAERGWTYKDILSFYFSGAKIVNLEKLQLKHLPLYQ